MIPAWVDPGEYPLAPRALDVDAVTMSDVDVGAGPAMLVVHGAVCVRYRRAPATADDRRVTWHYARELLASTDWYGGLWARRHRIASGPAVGHAPPRERGPEVAARVARFLEGRGDTR